MGKYPAPQKGRDRKRAAGNLDGAQLQEVTYEGYGPGGVAVVVSCMTDNRNRTVADVRSAFTRHGGNLGAEGSVAYLFNEVGVLGFPGAIGEHRLREAALEAGAEDIVAGDDGTIDVLTDPRDFVRVKEALERAGLTADSAQITRRSSVNTPLAGEDAGRMVRLLESLEDLDDVQDVYSNADISDEVLARL